MTEEGGKKDRENDEKERKERKRRRKKRKRERKDKNYVYWKKCSKSEKVALEQ